MFAVSIIDISIMYKKLSNVILFQIDKTSRVSKQYSQRAFSQMDFGITIDQWVLLKIIEENAPLSQKELAVRSFRDPASITRTLDLLGKKELIQRNPIKDNRRQYHIELTEQGMAFIAKHMDTIQQHREQSIKGFTETELQQLKEMLERIQRNME